MDKEQVICSWVIVVSKDLVDTVAESVASLVHMLTVQMCENIVCGTDDFLLFPLADWGWLRGELQGGMASSAEIYRFLFWPLWGSFPQPRRPQDLFSYLFIQWTGSWTTSQCCLCLIFLLFLVWDYSAKSICWLCKEESEGPIKSPDLWHLGAKHSQNWLFSFSTYFAICSTLAPIWKNYGVFLIPPWQF